MSQKSSGFRNFLFSSAVISHLLTSIGAAVAAGPSGSRDPFEGDETSTPAAATVASSSDSSSQTSEPDFETWTQQWFEGETEVRRGLLICYLRYLTDPNEDETRRRHDLTYLTSGTDLLRNEDCATAFHAMLWELVLNQAQPARLRTLASDSLWRWNIPSQNESRERLLNLSVEILLDAQEPDEMHFYANGLFLQNVIMPNPACLQFFYRSARPDSAQKITWDNESLEEFFYGILLDETRSTTLREKVIDSLREIGNARLLQNDGIQYGIVDEEGRACRNRLIGHLKTLAQTRTDPLSKKAEDYLWNSLPLTIDIMPFVLRHIAAIPQYKQNQALALLGRGDDADQALGERLLSWQLDVEREETPQPLRLGALPPQLLQIIFERYIRPILPLAPSTFIIEPPVELLGLYRERAILEEAFHTLIEENPDALKTPAEEPEPALEAAATTSGPVARTAPLLPLLLRRVIWEETALKERQTEWREHLKILKQRESEGNSNHDDLPPLWPQEFGNMLPSAPSEDDESHEN